MAGIDKQQFGTPLLAILAVRTSCIAVDIRQMPVLTCLELHDKGLRAMRYGPKQSMWLLLHMYIVGCDCDVFIKPL